MARKSRPPTPSNKDLADAERMVDNITKQGNQSIPQIVARVRGTGNNNSTGQGNNNSTGRRGRRGGN